ncbi:LiaI-LiaF-like domain-containing protein [Bacillus alkalicellulosilyticus]|uniref:LiaI-LiaF-like domain-containing protein n=1 Tax=Alkalihalobacterium alkalicellulosilyticum TaxID=1912214 RepID=UPI000997EA33|nr:DUF5668 domain-containing protein [Bacillus alkalicellulosilyticus]
MKRQGIFPGVLFIGVGLFFFIQQFNVPFLDQFLTWPSILVVIGVAFLFQAFVGDNTYLFPGALLTGLGIHFHLLHHITTWPTHWAMYTLIVGLSFIFLYMKTKKEGLWPGIILLIVSVLGFISGGFVTWFNSIFSVIESFWPILLIILGIYLVVRRK